MRLDRRVPGAVSYPADYGLVPDTLSVDGDLLDAIVLLEEPAFPGVCVSCRPVGVCWTLDSSLLEPKLICVLLTDPSFVGIERLDGVPRYLLDEIRQFFDTYQLLEPARDSRTDHFDGSDVARAVVADARRRALHRV